MVRVRRAVWLLLVVLPLAIWFTGCGKSGEDKVVARVGRTNITYSNLMDKMNELPPFARQQFAGPEGTIDFLNRIVDEEVLYQAAIQGGYENDPDVQRAVEAVKRRAVIQAFYKNEIEDQTQVSDEAIRKYYDEHSEQFQRRGRVKFRNILVPTKSAALAARARIMGGENFAAVARDVSQDEATKSAGGLMASVAIGEGVPSEGMDKDFVKKVAEWKVGEVTDPIQSSRGWNVLLLEEKVEPGTKPLDEVRDLIVKSLEPAETREYYQRKLDELKNDYAVRVNEEAFRAKPRTEEELFALAQEADDPFDRLNYYSELVFNYPDGEHAAEAQFMIGFIHAEELKNYEAARNAFQRMKDKYPDSDLVASADWMLEHMGEENPPFEESDVIESH
jgi:peptidyl-prolyl cis-trans isomerase C